MSLFELVLFWLPVLAGLIFIFLPQRLRKTPLFMAYLITILVFIFQIIVFIQRPHLGKYFQIDNLNGFILIFTGLFTLLTVIYSSAYFSSKLSMFCSYVLLTLGASNFTILTNNLLLLLVGWGFLGAVFYLLINFSSPQSASSGKKAFIILGGADAFLLFGIAILWKLTASFDFDKISSILPALKNYSGLINISLICFLVASFAKAGAFPLHTWLIGISDTTSIPTMAYIPASLDKLLGIYLLTRALLDIFKVSASHWVSLFLVSLGAFTIIVGVMMALVQHNVRKLLSYHAVSQVGYMILGIGTLSPIGILGGLFHMLNNAVYKSCLFLSAGNVEKRTNTLELSDLGGLAKFMPVTFFAMLIASLSISGIPPFNGFFSKWMIYQGAIFQFVNRDASFFTRSVYMTALVLAMIGSALTLASFLKVLFGIFLGQRSSEVGRIKEASKSMIYPVVILAGLCIVLGITAHRFVMPYLINPLQLKSASGVWMPQLAAILIIIGLILGGIIFAVSKVKIRYSRCFIGGEHLSNDVRPRATEFYNQIEKMGFLSVMYKLAERKVFDLYEICTKITFAFIRFLRYLHNGVLPTYLVWCLIGIVILLFKLLK